MYVVVFIITLMQFFSGLWTPRIPSGIPCGGVVLRAGDPRGFEDISRGVASCPATEMTGDGSNNTQPFLGEFWGCWV